MSAQDIILGARVAHVRELKTEVDRLKRENASLRDELAMLRAHLDQAILAAAELRMLPTGGILEIWDGWNLILGAQKAARDRNDLYAQARRRLAEDKALRIWIVLDGPDESVRLEDDGRLRVSYTGGAGAHRADKFICDYLRAAAYLGFADRVTVRTNDRDFVKTVARLKKQSVYGARFERLKG